MDVLESGDPRSLGGYALLGRLGAGGQGVVYLGQSQSRHRVAVKALSLASVADPEARRRFAGEVALVRQVSSFCVAEVLDADLDGARPYIVSEYVEGMSLQATVTAEGPRTEGALRRLAVGTMTALTAIHAAGIVHRDFKPHNVLLGGDGPRVIDFGIARLLESTATVTGHIVGTVAYMSPEQISGGHIGPASDMFGWAATMAYAAGGRPPFGQDAVPAVIYRVLHGEPDLPDLPPDLGDIVSACLAKDPRLRPSARDLLLRLIGDERPPEAREAVTLRDIPAATLRETPTLAAGQAPQRTVVAPPVKRRRRRLIAAVLATAVAAAVAATAVALWPGTTKPPAAAPATGTELYRDDFTERAGWDGWTFNPDAPGEQRSTRGYEIEHGVYTMRVDRTSPTNTSSSPIPAKNPAAPNQVEKNLMFGVLAQVRESSGPGELGLLCRYDEDKGNGYMFLINQDGTARALRHEQGINHPVASSAQTTAPRAGRTLRLQASCHQENTGTHLTLWVNGKKIIDGTDAPGLPDDTISQIGLHLQIPESSNGVLTVSFDEFSVNRPQ
jgi:predicted Ser/Thr protein kinase